MRKLSIEPIKEQLWQEISQNRQALQKTPRLAVLRCVGDPYTEEEEKKIRDACQKAGAEVWTAALPNYLEESLLVRAAHQVSGDPSVQGVYVFCPRQYDRGKIGAAIGTDKDVAGFGFSDGGIYPPCSLEAVMRIAAFYGLFGKGVKAGILYRDRKFAESLGGALTETGTEVKICRWNQAESPKFCREADLLITAVGIPAAVGKEYLSAGQTVLDAGCSTNCEEQIQSDLSEEAAARAKAAVLSPGGVDALCPDLLALHLMQTSRRQEEREI